MRLIDEQRLVALFGGIGFRCRPEPWNRAEAVDGRQFPKLVFAPPAGARTANVHVRQCGGGNARFALLFRDYLRSDGSDGDARRAVPCGPPGRDPAPPVEGIASLVSPSVPGYPRVSDPLPGSAEQVEVPMGMDDKIDNKAEEVGGKVKEGVGKATDDERLEAEGKADQTGSKLKQAGENIKDAFKS